MSTSPDRPLSPFASATDRPVFIGAAPRSGTTLLRLMLNASPELGLPRETKLLVTAWDEQGEFGDLADPANRQRLADRLIETLPSPTSPRLGVPPPELRERMLAAPPTLGSMVGAAVATYADQNHKPRWGDKRPVYSRYLDAIFTMFPDAQFIHVVRDPRAASASMAQMWYDGSVALGTELWERSLRAVEPWRNLLAPDQFYEFRYEDLIADAEGVLKKLAAFLAIAPQSVAAMLRYHEHGDETSPVHPDVIKPPMVANIDKWRTVLDEGETAFVEDVTAPWMQRYGYEPVASRATPAEHAVAAYQKRQATMLKRREVREREEQRLLLPPQRPVVARLTSSQLAGMEPTPMPPPSQRWIGRPA